MRKLLVAAGLAALLVAVLAGAEITAQGRDSSVIGFVMQARDRLRSSDLVEEGDAAPDFALVPLRRYDFGIDASFASDASRDEKYPLVRLSDFRGVKPVALIFGSYT